MRTQSDKEREEIRAKAHPDPSFDVSRMIRMVPYFQESEVDRYFSMFEKIAISMKWPKTIGHRYYKQC